MSWRIALAFVALGVVTRLPFQTNDLWAHDSVLYERAIARFSPIDQQPQPPGYLYYVLTIRAVDAITGDANRAMTVVSLVADALAIGLLYVLAARLYDERTARISALFLLTAVTFWAYAGIAYPYTLLGLLTIACALLFWRAMTAQRGRIAALALASAVWGIAIGFRSDLAIFLAPLWLLASWSAGIVGAVLGASIVASLFAVWYLASAFADGGLASFGEALRVQGQFVDDRYSIFGGQALARLYNNAYELSRYLGRGLYFLAPLVAVVPLSLSARHIELADRRRAAFVALWTLTPLAVYVPIHSGEYGYVFSMIPGFSIIAARGAIALARGLRRPRVLPWIVAAVVLADSALFLMSDTPLSARDVIRKDRGTIEKLEYLETASDLRGATIIGAYDALVLVYYTSPNSPRGEHPHNTLSYDPMNAPIDFTFGTTVCGPGVGTLQGCANSSVLAVWDDLVRVSGPGWESVTMPHGSKLRIARNAAGMHVHIEGLDVTLSR